MNYKDKQYERQESLIEQGVIFDGVKGGGRFMGKPRPFVLKKVEKNLYAPIQAKVLKYFKENRMVAREETIWSYFIITNSLSKSFGSDYE